MGLRRLWWLLLLGACADAWRTPDQQGRILYERGEYAAAAERFRDPAWKGVASVSAKDFEAAAYAFEGDPTANGFYNTGVCLSLLGKYEDAIGMFDEALALDPAHEDARFNRDLVARILKARDADAERPDTDYTHFAPDEIRFDEKGKKGKAGEVSGGEAQVGELWLRQISTTPADFLKRKFALQAQK